ncbi:hypothetical protein [Kineococcus esterisolvens]|uniref:hypothetical protein n=1 Tax=unclassified Kineococcus TaxID=2621656 RepID=UPI003D7DC4B2
MHRLHVGVGIDRVWHQGPAAAGGVDAVGGQEHLRCAGGEQAQGFHGCVHHGPHEPRSAAGSSAPSAAAVEVPS